MNSREPSAVIYRHRGSRRGRSAIASEARKYSEGPSDEEVVARAQEGYHAAFQILVDRYQGRAYGLALRILRNEEQARDAVQDSFLKVYGSIRRFEGRSSFYTWLYRLVFNQCLDLKRKDKTNRHVEWEDERMGEDLVVEETGAGAVGAGGFAGPGVELERRELRKMMAEAIDHMPIPRRDKSTVVGSPVRSRLSSAAAIPPARASPAVLSPKAPLGIGEGR